MGPSGVINQPLTRLERKGGKEASSPPPVTPKDTMKILNCFITLGTSVIALAALATPALAGRCGWTSTLYNAYEPVNSVRMEGVADSMGGCHADTLIFSGVWSDGPMTAFIYPRGGAFVWQVDNKEGVSATMEDAWTNMPAFITDPDDSQEHSEWED